MRLEIETDPLPEDCESIRDRLNGYNGALAGDDGFKPLTAFARDDAGAIVGGLLGETFWRWLHVSILWVDADSRGQGVGTHLLKLAEDEAIARECIGAFLDSLSFQSPTFYLKSGYSIWGEIEDLPPGHRRVFLQKRLDG